MNETAPVTALSDLVKTKMEENKWSLREAEAQWDIPRSTLERLVKDIGEQRIDTLEQLATVLGLPLWRVIEMAGYDVGLPKTPDVQAQRVAALVQAMPQFQPVVDHLLDLHPEDLEATLVYLESLQLRRERRNQG